MSSRFVVVPATPKETASTRSGSRFYCRTSAIGFDIYDNEQKLRLKTTYQTRLDAENECVRFNMDRPQSDLPEVDTMLR